MARKPPTPKTIEAISHEGVKRKNIPTAEYESVVEKDQLKSKKVRYPRNTDLDPQLVWRGKDEQDSRDLVVHAPPLYVQEKVHPKALIDDLLKTSKEAEDAHDHSHHDQHHDLMFDTWTFTSDIPMKLGLIQQLLSHLPSTLFRIKGFVHAVEEPQSRMVLQLVGRRATYTAEHARR